jgi:alanine racemase
VADDPSQGCFTDTQVRRFAAVCEGIEAGGVRVPARHVANSAGILATDAHFDLVRPGIVLYGYSPHGAADVDLRPVLALKARVAHVRDLPAGERVSYGRRYQLSEPSLIATVPLGYADGVPRRLSSAGATVLIRGRHRQIAGTITMDQLMVDCGPGSDVTVGDEVVLLGRQGDASIDAEDWAERLDTISYEILCGIGPRVPRVYLR